MIAKPEEVRALVQGLTTSVWTLAAIGVLFESGLVVHLREPRALDELAALCPALPPGRIERLFAVVAGTGLVTEAEGRYQLAEGALPFLQPPMRAALEGDVRSQLMQSLAFLESARGPCPGPGWRHSDPAILQAQGDASAAFSPMFKAMMLPALGDLGARLEQPGARFLDVGVGVAALAISMCRAFPKLEAVGLDIAEAPLAVARKNVADAGMGERIALRQQSVETLSDEEAFDLAWLPSFFFDPPTLRAAVARVHAALRPGGWVLLPVAPAGGEERQRSVFALLNELWGGPVTAVATAEAMLGEAGFSAARALPGPAWAPTMVVGQR